MDDDLICNYKKCRKRLTNYAWVTSCSHIFCDEDGTREFSKQSICPACETELRGQYDITKVDLHPSEQYKSMVLAGHRPDTIVEICSRALSFWTYQSHQERAYQEYCASKAIEKAQEQESYYEQALAVHTSEISSLKSHVSALKKDLESTRSKFNETSEKLMEKNRQYHKLQGMYETLRRRTIVPAVFEDGSHSSPARQLQRKKPTFEIPLGLQAEREALLPHQFHQPLHLMRRPHMPIPTNMLPGPPPRMVTGPNDFTISSTSVAARKMAAVDPTIESLVNATTNTSTSIDYTQAQ